MALRPTDPTHKISGILIRESERARLVSISSIGDELLVSTREEWFPVSQTATCSTFPDGRIELKVSRWIFLQKELNTLETTPELPEPPDYEDDGFNYDPPF